MRHRLLAPLLAPLTAACSYLTDEPMYAPTAPDTGPLTVTDSTPADGATDVALGAALVVRFSDFPDPGSIGTFCPPPSNECAILLRSGQSSFDFDARVDLVDRAVVVRPRTALTPMTQYALVLGQAVASLAGARLVPATVTFTTGVTPGGGPPPPPVRTLADDVQPLFDASCAGRGCHAPPVPQAGMDLSAGVAAAHLVGVRSATSDIARVDAGKPETSYLLRKLLATPDVIGAQMPVGPPWPNDALRVVSDWIAQGAP